MAAKTITPEQKRAQEKQTVGLMIALYCHGNHGTPKGSFAQTARPCRSTPMRGWTTAHIWPKRPSAASARPTATSRKCGSASARLCAGAARRMLFHHPVLAVRHLVETRKQKKSQ